MTAKNYVAWEVRESDYPENGSMEDRLKFLLRYAILAPSGPNSQPWKFSLNESSISVFADLKRALPFVDPSNRTLFMSVGCAIANLVVAAEHFGFSVGVNYFPAGQESDWVAEVQLSPNSRKDSRDLFAQIQKRHTTKDRYDNASINPSVLAELAEGFNRPGIYLTFLDRGDARARMVDLVSRAHEIQLAKKEFRQNLGQWLRNNWTTQPDGMPLYTFGVPGAISLGFPVAFKEFDLSRAVIYRDAGLINGCAALAVITTDQDDKHAWTTSGLALEELLLSGTGYDIRASFFSQPIGLPELREELTNYVNRGHPQILFSLGMANPMRPSPRRPLEDVVVKPSQD
jgi:hypothetical protein